MLKIVKRERFYEFELILAEIENDEKVQAVKVKTVPEWNNRVIDIVVYYRSGRTVTYHCALTNRKVPIKYRNYVTKIMEEVK